MKLTILLSVIFLLIITGCGITGNVVESGVAQREAENIVNDRLREMQGSYHNLILDVDEIGGYWVLNSIGVNTRIFWVNKLTGEIDCMNMNTKQPIDCL